MVEHSHQVLLRIQKHSSIDSIPRQSEDTHCSSVGVPVPIKSRGIFPAENGIVTPVALSGK